MVFSAYWHRKKVFIKRLSILVQLDRLTISRRLTNRLYTRRPQLPPTALQTWRPNPPVIAPTCSSSLTSSNSLLCCLRAPFVLFHFYSHYKTLSNLMPGEVSGRQFVKKKKKKNTTTSMWTTCQGLITLVIHNCEKPCVGPIVHIRTKKNRIGHGGLF